MQKPYQVKLLFETKNKKYLVFSLPQTNQYQEINYLSLDSEPLITISNEWGNRVECFSLNDVGKINLQFHFNPKSVEKKIQNNWTIHDYKKDHLTDFYTRSNRFINGNDAAIKKLCLTLVSNEQNILTIAQTLHNFVLSYLSYGNPTEGLYPYKQALNDKMTDCGGFSTLLLSLFQSVGIPGRLVVGFLVKENITHKLLSTLSFSFLTFNSLTMHAWPEILLPDNSWFPMDPSIEWRRDNNQSKRLGGFGEIPADRLITSFGQDFKFSIGKKKYMIDLLQHPIYL